VPLHKILKPIHNFDLLRVGKKNDGGYLVGKSSLEKSKFLISLGLNLDWSFEKDFLLKSKQHIIAQCYDDVLDRNFLIKDLVNKFILSLYKMQTRHFFKSLINYLDFIKMNKLIEFSKKKIFYNDLNKVLKKLPGNIFLKIDIDGGEYRILNDILHNQKKILGLVIEFHDHDLHKEIIKKFIKSLKLTLVHIHANNFAPLDLNGDPTVFELTFDRYPVKLNNKNVQLPNKFDMPNKHDGKNIKLNFNS